MNKTVSVKVSPVLTVHATYAANDYVGTSGAAMEFAGVATLQNFSGTILEACLIDGAAQSIAAELWLFSAAPTPPADSAAWSISDADAANLIAVIPFSTYYASALNSFSRGSINGIGFMLPPGTTSLYGCLVTRGAPTYASGDLTVRLLVWQD